MVLVEGSIVCALVGPGRISLNSSKWHWHAAVSRHRKNRWRFLRVHYTLAFLGDEIQGLLFGGHGPLLFLLKFLQFLPLLRIRKGEDSTLRPTLTLTFVAGSVTVLATLNGTASASFPTALVRTATLGTDCTSFEVRSGTIMPRLARRIRIDSDIAGENSDRTSSKREGVSDGAGVPIKASPEDGSSLP